LKTLRQLVDEIVVVDGESGDKTLRIAKRYADKILYDDGKGLGYAREIGRRSCSCELIATVDSDALVHPSFFERASELMKKDQKIGAISSKIVPAIENPRSPLEKFQVWNISAQVHMNLPEYPKTVQSLPCTVTLYRAEALEKAGGFDQRMKLCREDSSVSHRLTRTGYTLHYLPAKSHHIERAEHFKVNRKYGKGWKAYRKCYPEYAGIKHICATLAHVIPVIPFAYWIYRYVKLYWRTPLKREILNLSLMETWRHMERLIGLLT
jgi:glycosyltransferase involved in cell wall biosynthesis